jgi:DNA-binding transcriptional regulator GbsR (MarR family)
MKDKNNNGFQVEFANTLGMLASRLSLNPTVGQIYGLLYMSQNPVSLNEMVEKLGISKGSVSINVRVLESWGAVKKVWVDNSRKDYYEANPDTLSVIMSRIKNGLSRRLEEVGTRMSSVEDKFSMETNTITESEKKFYDKRIHKIKDMYQQVISFVDLISNGENSNEK